MTDYENLLDQLAMSALSALINKLPFFDLEGEHGKQVLEEEMKEIKRSLTRAAYEYASYMLIARVEYLEWLEKHKQEIKTN